MTIERLLTIIILVILIIWLARLSGGGRVSVPPPVQDRARQADPRARVAVTLLHEVVHAIFKIAGLPNEKEEDTVTRLSPLLLDTLRRNPDLVAYLLGVPDEL
jgi:hypothetical protein